jgi:hypothetical protein
MAQCCVLRCKNQSEGHMVLPLGSDAVTFELSACGTHRALIESGAPFEMDSDSRYVLMGDDLDPNRF